MEAVVWKPVTGSQCHIAFPPDCIFTIYFRLSPFKLVLLFNNGEENLAMCICFPCQHLGYSQEIEAGM
jgi:hypothetical protein